MTNYLPEGLSIDNKKHHPAAVKLYNTIQQFKVVKKD
jgi:hypothetical protein